MSSYPSKAPPTLRHENKYIKMYDLWWWNLLVENVVEMIRQVFSDEIIQVAALHIGEMQVDLFRNDRHSTVLDTA